MAANGEGGLRGAKGRGQRREDAIEGRAVCQDHCAHSMCSEESCTGSWGHPVLLALSALSWQGSPCGIHPQPGAHSPHTPSWNPDLSPKLWIPISRHLLGSPQNVL